MCIRVAEDSPWVEPKVKKTIRREKWAKRLPREEQPRGERPAAAKLHAWHSQELPRPRRPEAPPAGEANALERVALAEVGPGGYRRFGDIPAHRLGRELRAEFYRLANKLPEEEKGNLGQRIKYAATTVTASLATGFGTGDFRTVITRALESRGALYALQDHLQQASDQGWLEEVERERLSLRIDEVVRALNDYLGAISRERQRLSLETV